MTTDTFELAIERHIDAPPDIVYRAWTGRFADWWCPKPWRTEIVEIDLRPGGRLAVIMRGPGGETSPVEGVFVEHVPNRSIAFTDAFTTGWKPRKPFMVGWFSLEPEGSGTRYRAGARHWNEADHRQHQAMGFEQGWSAVAAQLAAIAEEMHRAKA